MNTKPIKLTLERPYDKVPRCGSRFWGNPDLPVGYGYPSFEDEDGEPFEYQFVCQINLADIAEFDPEGLLPHKGLLSFFAKIDSYIGYYDRPGCIGGAVSGSDDVRVMYFPSCADLEETVPEDGEGSPSAPAELRIGFSFGLPPAEDEHAVFALPTHRPWEDWDSPFEGWQILLQVDSFGGDDFELNFMDTGVLDFLISLSDLKHCDFSDVRAVVLSS